MAKGKSKTLFQALTQRNRITDYYERTGRKATADRIRRGTTGVGGVIGNMADRVGMEGGDYMDYRDMKLPISYEERTKGPTDAEYDTAVKKNKNNPTKRIVSNRKKVEYREARMAQGLSAG